MKRLLSDALQRQGTFDNLALEHQESIISDSASQLQTMIAKSIKLTVQQQKEAQASKPLIKEL